MYKNLKVKLYPTHKQKQVLENHFNGYRYCYNLCLDYKQHLWAYHKINISGFSMQAELFEIIKNSGLKIPGESVENSCTGKVNEAESKRLTIKQI